MQSGVELPCFPNASDGGDIFRAIRCHLNYAQAEFRARRI